MMFLIWTIYAVYMCVICMWMLCDLTWMVYGVDIHLIWIVYDVYGVDMDDAGGVSC